MDLSDSEIFDLRRFANGQWEEKHFASINFEKYFWTNYEILRTIFFDPQSLQGCRGI